MAFPGIPDPLSTLVNGNRYDFSSVQANFGPLSFDTIQAIQYEESLEPGIMRANSSKKQGRTRGEHDATGSITLIKEDVPALQALLAALGQGGWGEAVWDITVTYSAALVDPNPTVDVLIGCRITSISDDHSIGGDVLVQELSLDIMDITRNGLSMTSGGNSLAGAGAAIGGAALGSL